MTKQRIAHCPAHQQRRRLAQQCKPAHQRHIFARQQQAQSFIHSRKLTPMQVE
jgi:hypothetical protein